MIAAQQYYIDYGPDVSQERLQALMNTYIPDHSLQGMKAMHFWTQGLCDPFITYRIFPSKRPL